MANDSHTQIVIDLVRKRVTCSSLTVTVDISESARQALVEGSWDTTAQLLAGRREIEATAGAIPYMGWSVEG